MNEIYISKDIQKKMTFQEWLEYEHLQEEYRTNGIRHQFLLCCKYIDYYYN